MQSVVGEKGRKRLDYKRRTTHQVNEETLNAVMTKYLLNDDTCSTTFYMNPDFEGVVAFKEN